MYEAEGELIDRVLGPYKILVVQKRKTQLESHTDADKRTILRVQIIQDKVPTSFE